MKKIIKIFLFINFLYAGECEVTFIVKKSTPHYPYLFKKEKFICKNQKEGWNYQKTLGCRKRNVLKNMKKYKLYICPLWVDLVKK